MNPLNIQVITNREDHFRQMGWSSFANLQNVLFSLDYVDTVSFDLETTGLSSYRIEKVNAASIGIPGHQYVFDIPSLPGGLSILKSPLERKLVIGHNLSFDLPYVFDAGIVVRNVFDTQIAEEVLLLGLDVRYVEDVFKNLADVLRRRLGITLDKSRQETIAEGINSVEDIVYTGSDVKDLADLRDSQLKAANAQSVHRRVAFENKFLPSLVYIEYCGFRIDRERLYKWIRKIEAQEWIAEEKMKTYSDINWGSTQQVGELLKSYGIEEYTEKGNPQTDESVLKKYDIPIAKDLLELRGLTKLVDTYGRKWLHLLQDDERIHTRFKPLVATGRTSCGNMSKDKGEPWHPSYVVKTPFPNLQNLPSDPEHRALFCAAKGNTLIVCDYSSQESYIIAEKSGDPAMMDFFKNGDGDMHSFVTRGVNPELAHLSSEEIARDYPAIRKKNKEATYALAYGGNEKTVADNINIPVEEAKVFHDKYFALFSGLKPYYKKCYDRAVTLGYIPLDTLTGGKRYFDKVEEYQGQYKDRKFWDRYYDEKKGNTKWYKEHAERLKWYHAMTSELRKISVNGEVQGTAAVMTKLAMIYFFDWICDNGHFGKVKIVNMIHDEIVVECKLKLAEEVSKKLQYCMELAASKLLHTLKMPAIPKITDVWTK